MLAWLAWRWYYLDEDEPFIIADTTYPEGRMVFRTELTRAEPPSRA